AVGYGPNDEIAGQGRLRRIKNINSLPGRPPMRRSRCYRGGVSRYGNRVNAQAGIDAGIKTMIVFAALLALLPSMVKFRIHRSDTVVDTGVRTRPVTSA